ncbi:hypothetical protein L5515_009803 [Caenorhabditis briggsae]|uniref:Follistatin-like domain-containing protein n=1 Tax=Caenorhabditis briggsae TaxID=6238 RepID=A0AAE9F9S9_CAEBR|nr:hypothetical protein L5515_009803 [Caenorhabditis briggsae]
MKVIVLLGASLLVGLASGQLSSSRNQECKDHETFNTCGSACEPSCEIPNPSFCTMQCVIGCQCDSGFFRRSDNACVKKEECSQTANATAPVLPAILPAPANTTCGKNEEHNTCHNPCTEKKCPQKNAPLVNCLMACMDGCSCKSGFLRNMQGECVKEAECPAVEAPVDENPCNLAECAAGHKCVPKNGEATCIPVNPQLCSTVLCAPPTQCQVVNSRARCVKVPEDPPASITCANVRCAGRGGCLMVEPAGCIGCKQGPQCLAEPLEKTCDNTKCKSSHECVMCEPLNDAPAPGDKRCPGKNQKWVQCKTACSDVNCNEEPRMCAQVCRSGGCVCQEGFFRNKRGQCVTQNDYYSDTPSPLAPLNDNATDFNIQITPCSTMRCASGTECQNLERNCTTPPCETYGACVNTTVVDNLAGGCDTMRCEAGETCQEAMVKCAKAPCPRHAMCVLDMTQNDTLNSCASVTCPVGESCEETTVQCFVAPCPKKVSCVRVPIAFNPNRTIYGCEVVKCPTGEVCEESYDACPNPPCTTPYISCVPSSNPRNFSTVTCKNVKCPDDEICNETFLNCGDGQACTPYISCVPKSSGCGTVTCPNGEKCVERNLDCLIAPCPKAVSCVPMNANQNSTARQGCDVIRCRSNEICEETEVQCLMAPCPIQVACVSIIHTNGTTNSTSPGNSPSVCPRNQTMSDCLNKCSEEKCPGIGISMMCTKHCGQGCACAAGFVRSSDGECYKSKDCPLEQVCGDNEEYRCEKCAGTCKNPEPNCPGPHNKKCNKKCICAAGFVKKNRKCVTLASCPDHDHNEITCLGTEEYTDCLPKCRQLCSGVTECDKNMHTEMCTPGCVCRPSYKLDSNGTCVHNRHCFKTTDCPVNEEWSKCISDDNICGMATIQKVPLRDQCFSGCICAGGFARNSNGTCVEHDKC